MKQSETSLEFLVALVVLILGGILYQRLGPKVAAFWVIYGWKATWAAIICGVALLLYGTMVVWNTLVESLNDRALTSFDPTAVLLGADERGAKVYLKQEFRSGHAQIIGTTNAGKTESVVLPWVIQDIENGCGILIVDGKGDKSFLNKISSYANKSKRSEHFRLFSLAHTDKSCSFNPLLGGSPSEVAQRVFSSFPIEHPHYRATQANLFQALLTLVIELKKAPTFALIHQLLSNVTLLTTWLKDYEKINPANALFLNAFRDLPLSDRANNSSGLAANLMHFTTGPSAALFNVEEPQIDFDTVLKDGLICYFQLPTMYCPFLAEATGKLVLQCFQHAVSKRQLTLDSTPRFFSCFLDDFQDYIYPGFAALLNKARSANVGVVFSHQALGDLDKVSADFRNIVTTCTNIKVAMRSNDPDTADFLSKTFGTQTVEKVTERQKRSFFMTNKTGDGSAREVEQYLFHPNELKRLHRGHGIVSISHPRGVKLSRIRFQMRPNLAPAVAVSATPDTTAPKA